MPVRTEGGGESWTYCETCRGKNYVGRPHEKDCIRNLKKTADRWFALLNSARIRPLGCAGIVEKNNRNYAHLGLELWTKYCYDGVGASEESIEIAQAEHERGKEWLTNYVDVAIEAQKNG